MLVDSRLISNVISSTYHSILISNHAPLSLVIDFCWKLNPSLYLDVTFSGYISTKIADFLLINDNDAYFVGVF